MSDYRRNYVPGGTYFFTCTTHCRRPILTTERGRTSLREAIREVRLRYPVDLVAVVLLPDHWHAVWTLPPGDNRYPIRWTRIKEEFTKRWPIGITDKAPIAERLAQSLLGAHRPRRSGFRALR